MYSLALAFWLYASAYVYRYNYLFCVVYAVYRAIGSGNKRGRGAYENSEVSQL